MSRHRLPGYRQTRVREEAAEERRVLEGIERRLASDPWGATRESVHQGVAEAVPGMVYRLWQTGEFSTEELEDVVAWSWVHNRSPLRGLGERRWLQLFKATGFLIGFVDVVKGGEPVEATYRHLTELPTEPITVWRGAALSTHGRGMSWSVHRDCARDSFAQARANLSDGPSGLFRATIPPQAILALFGDEREQEVVVNPNRLRGHIALEEEVLPEQTRHPLGVFGGADR